MTSRGWQEQVSPWDAWLVFAVLVGLALWLVIDRNQYPAMQTWVRVAIATEMSLLGLWLALGETAEHLARETNGMSEPPAPNQGPASELGRDVIR